MCVRTTSGANEFSVHSLAPSRIGPSGGVGTYSDPDESRSEHEKWMSSASSLRSTPSKKRRPGENGEMERESGDESGNSSSLDSDDESSAAEAAAVSDREERLASDRDDGSDGANRGDG